MAPSPIVGLARRGLEHLVSRSVLVLAGASSDRRFLRAFRCPRPPDRLTGSAAWLLETRQPVGLVVEPEVALEQDRKRVDHPPPRDRAEHLAQADRRAARRV